MSPWGGIVRHTQPTLLEGSVEIDVDSVVYVGNQGRIACHFFNMLIPKWTPSNAGIVSNFPPYILSK